MGAALWGGYYIFIQFLTRAWDFTILATGLLLIPMTLSASVVGVPAGRLMDNRGHRPVMAPAAIVFTMSLLWLALGSGDERQVLAVWLPAAIGVGVANAVCFPGVNSAGAWLAPEGSLGITAGIIQTLIRIGGVTGTALGIALVGDLGTDPGASAFHPAFFAFAAVGFLALLTILPLSTKSATPAGAVLAGEAGTLTAS
jgi:DHA2 family lincomycin resistance protein-like MFS transporter